MIARFFTQFFCSYNTIYESKINLTCNKSFISIIWEAERRNSTLWRYRETVLLISSSNFVVDRDRTTRLAFSYNANNAMHRRPRIVGFTKKVTFAGNDLSIRWNNVPRTSERSICFSRTVKAERGFRRRDVDDKSNAEEWPIALSILPNKVEETPQNFTTDRLDGEITLSPRNCPRRAIKCSIRLTRRRDSRKAEWRKNRNILLLIRNLLYKFTRQK